ncbi:MAG: hypothetical protein Q8873_04560 [Bacillota bacterium]|nr:hypothetical protein [Bacillota bacterium]
MTKRHVPTTRDDDNGVFTVVGVAVSINVKRPTAAKTYNLTVINQVYDCEYINETGIHSNGIDFCAILQEALTERWGEER